MFFSFKESSEKINSILDEKGFKSGNKIVIIHPGSGGSSVDLPKDKLIVLGFEEKEKIDFCQKQNKPVFVKRRVFLWIIYTLKKLLFLTCAKVL